MPGRDAGCGQCPVQGGQGFGGHPGQHPALGQRPGAGRPGGRARQLARAPGWPPVPRPSCHRRGTGHRPAGQSCLAEPGGELATARVRSSAATLDAWPTSMSAVRVSQSSNHGSIGSAGPASPAVACSSCRATRSAARPPPRGHARHRGARRRGLPPVSRRIAPPGSADPGTRGAGRTRAARRQRTPRLPSGSGPPRCGPARWLDQAPRSPRRLAPPPAGLRAPARPRSRAGPLSLRTRSPARNRPSARRFRLGDGQTRTAGQGGDELGDVERVARRPVGEPQQVTAGSCRPGRAAGSITSGPVSPVSWSRAAWPATRRSASKSSRWGTGRIIPTSSSGAWRADLASRY